MIVHLVVQEGVYRHDICGVYSSAELAEEAAQRAAREDEDDYHSYEIYETALDQYVNDVYPTPGAPSFRGERPPAKPGPTAADITDFLKQRLYYTPKGQSE